jgi:hypothetical protein
LDFEVLILWAEQMDRQTRGKSWTSAKNEPLQMLSHSTAFQEPPPEIRLVILEYSLSGSHTLSVAGRRKPSGLFLYENDNPYNPAALSICRESREVALKHYRLCFGTTNLYADLSLDALYFGEDWWDQIFGSGAPGDGNLFKWHVRSGLQNRLPNQEYKDNVNASLQQATHLAFLSNFWSRFGNLHRSGAALRADAKAVFQKLTQLSLVTRQERDSYGSPGSVEFMNSNSNSLRWL